MDSSERPSFSENLLNLEYKALRFIVEKALPVMRNLPERTANFFDGIAERCMKRFEPDALELSRRLGVFDVMYRSGEFLHLIAGDANILMQGDLLSNLLELGQERVFVWMLKGVVKLFVGSDVPLPLFAGAKRVILWSGARISAPDSADAEELERIAVELRTRGDR